MKKFLILVSIQAALIVAATSPTCAAPGTGWLNPWLYRIPVAVSNPDATTLLNFQVEISLNSAFDFANAKPDGSDVRFAASDGTTLIPLWIQTWNASGQTATIWVQVPSIPSAGATVYLYYGNPAATSASNGDATFLFFDDFAPPNQGPQAYFQLGSPTTALLPSQTWETFSPHTLSVLPLNKGGHTYWGYYGLQDSCGGVGLAWSQDLVNWTKDTSDPLFTDGRWPSVLDVSGTLYMAYEFNYCGNSQINLASSTDGLNWTIVKTLVPQNYLGEPRNQNPNLWLDPKNGKFYLYFYNGNDSNLFNIKVRSASSPLGLDDTSTETTVLTSTVTLAGPNMLYYNGTYFLATEARDNEGNWVENVYASTTSPTSAFSLLPGNPVLSNNSACMFQQIFGTTLHEWYCHINASDVWELDHVTAHLTVPRPATPNPAKWTSSGGTWTETPDILRPDGSTGFVAQGTPSASPQLLYSTFTGTDYVLEAYGQQTQGRVWGLGFRVTDANHFYSINLYDDLNGSPNLWVYSRLNSSSSVLGNAAVSTVSPNTWYKLSARVQGSSFDIYKDGVFQFHTSDSSYASGGVALYGEQGSQGSMADYDDVLVRQFAVSDPMASLGPVQKNETGHSHEDHDCDESHDRDQSHCDDHSDQDHDGKDHGSDSHHDDGH